MIPSARLFATAGGVTPSAHLHGPTACASCTNTPWNTCSTDSRRLKRSSASFRSKKSLLLIALLVCENFLLLSPFVPIVEKKELSRRSRPHRSLRWSWGSSTNEIRQSSAEVGARKTQPANLHGKGNFRALRRSGRGSRYSPARRKHQWNVLQYANAVSRRRRPQSPVSSCPYWSRGAHSLRSALLPARCGRRRGIHRHFARGRSQNR